MSILIKSGVKKIIAQNKYRPSNIHKVHVLSTAHLLILLNSACVLANTKQMLIINKDHHFIILFETTKMIIGNETESISAKGTVCTCIIIGVFIS